MIKKLIVLVLCLNLFILSGCASQNQTQPNSQPDLKADSIMKDFNAIVQKNSNVEEVAAFISDNISLVAKDDASKMVVELEKLQQKSLPEFESLFAKEDLQTKIANEYQAIRVNDEIKDAQVKDLITKTKNSGYKVETAEGSFFPIIDYEFYKKFTNYVSPDIKDYINIMAVESKKVPAKDAALVIGWDEIINRSLSQEKFINTYKDSIKLNDVKQLYKKYVTFSLYGANNTPLFSYDANALDPEAREAYLAATKDVGSSDYLKTLSSFLDIVKKNNYKLTDEVESYRDSISKNLS